MRLRLFTFSVVLLFLCAFKSEKPVTDATLFRGAHVHQFQIPHQYFIHPTLGDDQNKGTSKEHPFKTLEKIESLKLSAGDQIILQNGQVYTGSLKLINQTGNEQHFIEIKSEDWQNAGVNAAATINFKGFENGILVKDCSFIKINNIQFTADGYDELDTQDKMRCAVLITSANVSLVQNILLDRLKIDNVYFENKGFTRGKEEVKSANGTQKYGWGIRVINNQPQTLIENIIIQNCEISNVSHTGIKLTGGDQNIKKVKILNNHLYKTGGPGMQMSGVQDVYVAHNLIQFSGNDDDSRKWGRGSGLWTWGSSDILIEKNQFLNANGPGDSAGAHIDYNCNNVVIQYNLSAFNAGGFCEILGNNYNCTYRYNISVNDGHRVKGENGAFQEGKTLWLSGFQGNKSPRKGPVNTYIYNNTIYTDASIHPKMAFDNTSKGILIVNNIFCLANPAQLVLGDQYKPDTKTNKQIENVFFQNNLFLNPDTWPKEMSLQDTNPIYGNPEFNQPGGLTIQDYLPKNLKLIKNKGLKILALANDDFGALHRTNMSTDILGRPIKGQPSLGAIEPIDD